MSALRRRLRWGSPPLLLDVLLLVPELLGGLSLLLVPAFLIEPWAAVAVLAVVMCVYLVVSTPRYEVVLARWAFGLHLPSGEVRARVHRLMLPMMSRPGMPRRLELLVEASEGVNASAFGGHVLTVTEGALALPDRMLSAVLAHELGHLVQGHAFLGPLRMLSALPRRAATQLSVLMLFGSVPSMLIGGPLLILVYVLSLPGRLMGLVRLPVARWAERSADVFAARLGHGPALAETLSGASPPPWWRSGFGLLSTHPSPRLRVDRIREFLRSLPLPPSDARLRG